MEQNYLLTYDVVIKQLNTNIQTYCWFEHEEDMEEYIANNDIIVIEKLKINSCEHLQVNN